ncbi:MAG: hypothetical protein IPM39_13635 [Chloroflexi bacterium]|nr:hypothetical protein [Chloroflexota bacterium]
MSVKLRFVLFVVLVFGVLMLTGCGAFGDNTIDPVQSSEITTTMRYLDGSTEGPAYDVSLMVPDAWVGQFVTQNLGNAVQFKYPVANPKLIFSIEALSATQYWQSSGSYPAGHTNIINLGDTYFVYHMPVDAYYSDLSPEEFQAFAALVPDIVASFTAVAVK